PALAAQDRVRGEDDRDEHEGRGEPHVAEAVDAQAHDAAAAEGAEDGGQRQRAAAAALGAARFQGRAREPDDERAGGDRGDEGDGDEERAGGAGARAVERPRGGGAEERDGAGGEEDAGGDDPFGDRCRTRALEEDQARDPEREEEAEREEPAAGTSTEAED